MLHKFYTSKPWRDLAYRLKIERGGKCERTGEVFADLSQLIGHHKIELNEDNVNNPQIALNPELIEIISHKEHNKEHRRFGNKQNVYIVWGSPLSGKSTMVKDLMQYGDIVFDIDEIWKAITYQDKYSKPNNVRNAVFALRDKFFDVVRTRYGQWYDAYIIGGYPNKYERERLAKELGAELIYCESTKEECLQRAKERPRWERYVNDWWESADTPPGV